MCVRNGRSATAAVEFAVIAPVFFLLVLGLVEVGRGIMVTHELNSAARDGCRVGVLPNKGYSDITAAVDNALQPQGIRGYSVTVLVNDVVVPPGSFAPSSNDQITVQVSVPVRNVTWLPGGQFLQGNLSGSFTLRRE
jgi:Flp pilus assembly protein TadG